ncbi:MAG: hypothetical protein WD875_05520 [Pirellulales bacterium]
MSEPQWPPIDVWHGRNSDGDGGKESAENEPPDGWYEFFRFDPAGFYAFHKRQIESFRCTKDKRDYYANAARKMRDWAFRSRTGILISVAAMACFLVLVIYLPDAVVALFTVVLTVLAYVQWKTMDGELEQVRRTADQTDRMILLDQRPWLNIGPPAMMPAISEWKAGEQLKLTMTVKNTGKTPAYIEWQSVVALCGKNADKKAVSEIAANMSPAHRAEVWVVAPHSSITINADGCPVLDEILIERVASDSWKIVVVAKIVYQDFFGNRHTSQRSSIYNPAVNEFWTHQDQGPMD